MKYLLVFLLICCMLLLGIGFYLKNTIDFAQGQLLIGIAVFTIAFVIMPLFIYFRYKSKNLSSFKSKKFDNK